MLADRRVAKHIMTIRRKTRSLFRTLLSNTWHRIQEGVHASGLGTRVGPHQWAGLSARLRRRLWTRPPESGFSPGGGRVVFITGLPTDACVFVLGPCAYASRFARKLKFVL